MKLPPKIRDTFANPKPMFAAFVLGIPGGLQQMDSGMNPILAGAYIAAGASVAGAIIIIGNSIQQPNKTAAYCARVAFMLAGIGLTAATTAYVGQKVEAFAQELGILETPTPESPGDSIKLKINAPSHSLN